MPGIEYLAQDVYGIQREEPLNYVERDNADVKLLENLTREKHIVIYGSSKQGKTCLRKHCLQDNEYVLVHCANTMSLADLNAGILKQAGFKVSLSEKIGLSGKRKVVASFEFPIKSSVFKASRESESSETIERTYADLELDTDDVNDVIDALRSIEFSKMIVLEDFHYLEIETQRRFAEELKAFHENSEYCFVIIGVWLEENRLVMYNGDLTGRVVSVDADLWDDIKLKDVIRRGEELLNVHFSSNFKDGLLAHAAGSVYIVQEACYIACKREGVAKTLTDRRTIGSSLDVPSIVRAVVDQQSGRYNAFLEFFAGGFQQAELEMYKWILYSILVSPEDKLKIGLRPVEIRKLIMTKHPRGGSLNPGNVTQALKYCGVAPVWTGHLLKLRR